MNILDVLKFNYNNDTFLLKKDSISDFNKIKNFDYKNNHMLKIIKEKNDDKSIQEFYDLIYKNDKISMECNQIIILKQYHRLYTLYVRYRLSIIIVVHAIIINKIMLNVLKCFDFEDKGFIDKRISMLSDKINIYEKEVGKLTEKMENYKNPENNKEEESRILELIEKSKLYKNLYDEEDKFFKSSFKADYIKVINDPFLVNLSINSKPSKDNLSINRYEKFDVLNNLSSYERKKINNFSYTGLNNTNIGAKYSFVNLISDEEDKGDKDNKKTVSKNRFLKKGNPFIFENIIDYDYFKQDGEENNCEKIIKKLEANIMENISNSEELIKSINIKSRELIMISKNPYICLKGLENYKENESIKNFKQNIKKNIEDNVRYLIQEGINYKELYNRKEKLELNTDLIDFDFFYELKNFSLFKEKKGYGNVFNLEQNKMRIKLKNLNNENSNKLLKLQYIYNKLGGIEANHKKFNVSKKETEKYDFTIGKLLKDNNFRVIKTKNVSDSFFDCIYKATYLNIKEQRKMISNSITKKIFLDFKNNLLKQIGEYEFMENILNEEHLKEFILTSYFAAENYSINFLLDKLKLSLIIFSENDNKFKEFKKDETKSDKINKFLIMSNNNMSYQLISYGITSIGTNNKRIFTESDTAIKKIKESEFFIN